MDRRSPSFFVPWFFVGWLDSLITVGWLLDRFFALSPTHLFFLPAFHSSRLVGFGFRCILHRRVGWFPLLPDRTFCGCGWLVPAIFYRGCYAFCCTAHHAHTICSLQHHATHHHVHHVTGLQRHMHTAALPYTTCFFAFSTRGWIHGLVGSPGLRLGSMGSPPHHWFPLGYGCWLLPPHAHHALLHHCTAPFSCCTTGRNAVLACTTRPAATTHDHLFTPAFTPACMPAPVADVRFCSAGWTVHILPATTAFCLPATPRLHMHHFTCAPPFHATLFAVAGTVRFTDHRGVRPVTVGWFIHHRRVAVSSGSERRWVER